MNFDPFGITKMKRLSLEELKAQKGNVVANLEAINGGNADSCHCGTCCKAYSTAAKSGTYNELTNILITIFCLFD